MLLASSRSVISCGLPMFDGVVDRRVHEPPDAVDEVVDVLERARLRAVAEHRDGLAGERLRDERGDRRPSFRRMRGPKVLKIRTMRVSTPWVRW